MTKNKLNSHRLRSSFNLKPIYCENCEKELTELDKETHTNWCEDCLIGESPYD